MRPFFQREVIPPDTERRNYLLKKLAFLKKKVKPVKGTQNIIKILRRQLKATEGRISYYRHDKGLKIHVGDDTTSKKKFLLSKDHGFLGDVKRKFRSENSSVLEVEFKDRYIDSLDMFLKYRTIGGVMEKPDYFRSEVKRINRRKVSAAKYPTDGDVDPYIGIELEYASSLTIDEVVDMIVEHKLHNDVRVMTDRSIRVNSVYPYQVEFCILTKWTGLKSILERLKPIIFDKPQYFSPNTSCGFHVHLDVRHDSPKRVFKNLTSMQSVLFNLAAEHRRGNTYCVPLTTTEFDEVDADAETAHYHAISKYSYYKHHTIEVRIHQSTLSLTQVEKWVTLLKRIADYKGQDMKLGTFESEFKILKEKVKIEPELVKYIEERKVL